MTPVSGDAEPSGTPGSPGPGLYCDPADPLVPAASPSLDPAVWRNSCLGGEWPGS